MKRKAKKPVEETKKWRFRFYSEYQSAYIKKEPKIRELLLYRLAGFVSIVENKEDANILFNALCILFLNKKRFHKRWEEALDELPIKEEALVNFGKLIRDYERLALEGYVDSLNTGKINLTQIIRYAVKVANKREAFLEVVKESWYTYPAKIFSATVVKEAADKYRGAFGDFADTNYDANTEVIE